MHKNIKNLTVLIVDDEIVNTMLLKALIDEEGFKDVDTYTDSVEALDAFQLLCRTEGIIPALEPAHAIAAVEREAKKMDRDQIILANLCGRGDKDIFTVAEALGTKI